jgi:hypothetical protein
MTAKPSTSLELLCPSAFQDLKTLLCAPLSKRPAGICPAHRKCRTQGLATLSTVSALQTRGSLFQPPTLLGFTLQSFFPLGEPDEPFGSNVPLLRFLTKPGSLVPALQRFDSPQEAVLLFATRRFSSGRSPLLSWAFRPLRLSRPKTDFESFNLSKCPSRPWSPSSLVRRGFRNLRGFRSQRLGVSHYRAPACLAFRPTVVRYLLETRLPADYFFISKLGISHEIPRSSLSGQSPSA